MISKEDLERVIITDDPDEIAEGIKRYTEDVGEHQNF